jgi:hypothetical protein
VLVILVFLACRILFPSIQVVIVDGIGDVSEIMVEQLITVRQMNCIVVMDFLLVLMKNVMTVTSPMEMDVTIFVR